MKKVEAKVLNKIRRPVITKLWTLNVSQRISTVLKIAVLIKTVFPEYRRSVPGLKSASTTGTNIGQ